MDASVIFRQMCMIFLLIAVGYIACKRGIVDALSGKMISAVVVNICNPALMLTSVLESGGGISNEKLVDMIRENFDLRPAGIIKMLDLRRPIYRQTAAYGHFGRTDLDLPWEKTDMTGVLRRYLLF